MLNLRKYLLNLFLFGFLFIFVQMTYNWFEMSSHAQLWTHFQQKSSVIKTRFPSVISEFPKRDTNAKEPGLTATKSESSLVKNLTDFKTEGQPLDLIDCKVNVETCKEGEKISSITWVYNRTYNSVSRTNHEIFLYCLN